MLGSSTNSAFPPIPIDIAQYVLELTAEVDTSSALQMTFVSRQVHRWAIKSLYRSVVIWRPSTFRKLLATLRCRPIGCEPYGRHIRLLSLEGEHAGQDVEEIILACPNLIGLALWYLVPQRPSLSISSSITRLLLRADTFQLKPDNYESDPAEPELTFLDKVTHLGIISLPAVRFRSWHWNNLSRTTTLTHLFLGTVSDGEDSIRFLDRIFCHFPKQLKVCVVLLPDVPNMLDDVYHYESMEPRLVFGIRISPVEFRPSNTPESILSVTGIHMLWEWGAVKMTDTTTWDLAERIVSKRLEQR